MEYIFGTSTRNGRLQENLKTIANEQSNLTGYVNIIREYGDGSKIEDRCHIVEKYASKQVDGLFYDWYIIDEHYRNIDNSNKVKKEIDKVSANLDYISMMSGIDIPMEEEGVNNE